MFHTLGGVTANHTLYGAGNDLSSVLQCHPLCAPGPTGFWGVSTVEVYRLAGTLVSRMHVVFICTYCGLVGSVTRGCQ